MQRDLIEILGSIMHYDCSGCVENFAINLCKNWRRADDTPKIMKLQMFRAKVKKISNAVDIKMASFFSTSENV